MHGWLAFLIHLPALVVYFGSTALGRFLVLRSAGLTVRQALRVDGPTWQRLSSAQRVGTWAIPHLLALHAGFVLLVACGLATEVWANDGTVDPIPGRPAAMAGVLPGDRVVSVNGDPVHDFTDIGQHVKASSTDDIELEIDRGGTSLRLRVRRIDGLLGLRPSPREATLTDALEFATTFPIATVRSWASAITGDPDVRFGGPVDASEILASRGVGTLPYLVAYVALQLFMAVPILCAIGTPWRFVFRKVTTPSR
jgi:hypothetical protein